MDMLATLLNFGLDPEHFDSSLFVAWPQSCDPGWLAEDLAPDPMFIEFFRACLQKQPGFAGCDDLTDAVLTGEESEFETALCRARGECGFLRMFPNALGQTATHLSVSSPGRLRKLLEAGADPDCVDRAGLTPLMYAAAYGEHQSVLHLVEFQATWGLQERLYGRNFLDYAIRRRHMKVIESLIDWLGEAGDHGTASEVLDHCIAYCIVQCNDHYDTTIPHRLFELGADADTIVNRRTLMHLATTSKMSQLIMKKNFTLFHSRDDSGKTALMQVANLVDANTLTTVASQEQAADFNAQDARGKTALHYLLRSRYLHVDYNKDEIKHRFGFEFAPPICEVTIDCYKGWLRWCDRNFVKLDIKGGRRNYTEYGWHLVSMFEDKVEELRSSTETWYTAPEQTAETP
ncbi:hypothetical protein D0865_01152 [Hortaea werneckii]|uniref:Uncharacterized protein n=1 Tax=Hortaea werneckii TaxID=91943 RepID=A0A3M7DB52_HORWE|nr:hypothetical protein D0865_01152 [Hortaea werneckii]